MYIFYVLFINVLFQNALDVSFITIFFQVIKRHQILKIILIFADFPRFLSFFLVIWLFPPPPSVCTIICERQEATWETIIRTFLDSDFGLEGEGSVREHRMRTIRDAGVGSEWKRRKNGLKML